MRLIDWLLGTTKNAAKTNLPDFRAKSSGWARPNPDGDIVATLMPHDADIQAPWGVLSGKAGQHYHQVSKLKNENGKVDEYTNDKFGEDFRIIRTLGRGQDARADRLFDIYGDDAVVVLAQKTAPVIVLGVCKSAGQFVTSESKGDKKHEYAPGSVVVTNLKRDRVWVISAEAFKDLYEGGKINPGNPPTV
jgi:hypothetical protein